MNMLTLMVTAVMVATIGALGLGVLSMVRNGQVGQLESKQWMAIRVLLQAATVVVLAAGLFAAIGC
jgi:Hypoxia induced protein conserved region